MTRNSVAASVAQNKERNPDKYCPVKKCLWRTGGGLCPRHATSAGPSSFVAERVAFPQSARKANMDEIERQS
jgi:hypothetical protein